MPFVTRIVALAVSTIVTAVLTKYITELLEEKPLLDRIDDAKSKVVDLKAVANEKYSAAKDSFEVKLQALSEKVDSLIQKSDKTDV